MAGGAAHTTAPRRLLFPSRGTDAACSRPSTGGFWHEGRPARWPSVPGPCVPPYCLLCHADVARVAWYRFRRTLRRRWGGYLALTLLLGLRRRPRHGLGRRRPPHPGGIPAYLASTNPSDLTVLTGLYGVAGQQGLRPGRDREDRRAAPASGTSPATKG